jgi:hypothetical protein
MPARPYSASGQSNPGALLRLVAVCGGAALAAGLVEGFISQWLSLLLLFPILLGGVVGFAAAKVIGSAHIRAPGIAVAVALIAGLFAQLTVVGVQYFKFRSDLRSELGELPSGLPIDQAVDEAIVQSGGHSGFLGYLELRARAGTEISRSGHKTGINLSGTSFWILFAINFALAAGVAAGQARERVNVPYCEPCQRWYERSVFVTQGSGDKQTVSSLKKSLEQGTFEELPATVGTPQPGAQATLQLLRCDSCQDHEPQLSVTVTTGDRKKQNSKVVYKSMLRADEGQRLLTAFAEGKPAS